MKSLLLSMLLLLGSANLIAQHTPLQAYAITDKEIYLCGERVHVSVSVTQPAGTQPSTVAYVELTDARHLCSQTMITLQDGLGWGDLVLPEQLHSGNYLLSVYTRPMLVNDTVTGAAHKVLSVINASRASRFDELNILDPEADTLRTSDVTSLISTRHTTTAPATTAFAANRITVDNPFSDATDAGFTTVTLASIDITSPDYQQTSPLIERINVKQSLIEQMPEVEGHVIVARPNSEKKVADTRLVMVGRMAAIYDGQPQSDGTFAYYTNNLHGKLPTLINAYDEEGQPITMDFISPYAQLLAKNLPRLKIYATESQLRERSLCAQREQLITEFQAVDSLGLKTEYQSGKPIYSYDLDEWTNFSTVHEILIEFVRGVRRHKLRGVNHLFTVDPVTHTYSQWPALVLLDGMPVYDIDEILNYDARLLRYVNVYGDRYTFGNSYCQGIISFISRRGRLSNYKLDAGSRLVSYAFPQQRPAFLSPSENTAGTLYWNPEVTTPTITLPRLQASGRYQLIWQHLNPTTGQIERKVEEILL